MAVDAVCCDVDVIEICRQPCDRRMAVVTAIAAGDMGRVLAGSDNAIVAGVAGADDLCVIYREHRYPNV